MNKSTKNILITLFTALILMIGGHFLKIQPDAATRVITDLINLIDTRKIDNTPIHAAPSEPQVQDDAPLKIGAFNIQIFGVKKIGNTDIMEQLVKIAQEFDVMLVEEIRDSSQQTASAYLKEINDAVGYEKYAFVESEPLGRSSSKEQYAYFYNTKKVKLLDDYTYDDQNDAFEREPFIAKFQSGNFDFVLVGLHSKPEDTPAELSSLDNVVSELSEEDPSEHDIMLLGDFNADGSYFKEKDTTHPLKAAKYHWVITNDFDTMTKTDWTYDRIILLPETYDHEYQKESATVFRYDRIFGIANSFVQQISDHFPIMAEFNTADEDDD